MTTKVKRSAVKEPEDVLADAIVAVVSKVGVRKFADLMGAALSPFDTRYGHCFEVVLDDITEMFDHHDAWKSDEADALAAFSNAVDGVRFDYRRLRRL